MKKIWKNWKVRLARKTGPERILAQCATHAKHEEKLEELESPLSVKVRAKPEVNVKVKLPSAYIKRRKQKKKTQSLTPFSRWGHVRTQGGNGSSVGGDCCLIMR